MKYSLILLISFASLLRAEVKSTPLPKNLKQMYNCFNDFFQDPAKVPSLKQLMSESPEDFKIVIQEIPYSQEPEKVTQAMTKLVEIFYKLSDKPQDPVCSGGLLLHYLIHYAPPPQMNYERLE